MESALEASQLNVKTAPATNRFGDFSVSVGQRHFPSPPHAKSRYKTELCRPWEESGVCKYADKCQFSHGATELRPVNRHPKFKTELCRTYHTLGICPYGHRCHFVHNESPASRDNSSASSSSSDGL